MTSKELVELAQHYASKYGIAVTPVVGKKPALKEWLKKATTQPDEIQHLFDQVPSADGVGLVPGRGGYIVMDVDLKCKVDEETAQCNLPGRHGRHGEDELLAIEAEYGALPRTAEAKTPSGGRHLWFKKPNANEKYGNSDPWKSIDIRADGGQVVLREWIVPLEEAVTLPQAIVDVLSSITNSNRDPSSKEESLRLVSEPFWNWIVGPAECWGPRRREDPKAPNGLGFTVQMSRTRKAGECWHESISLGHAGYDTFHTWSPNIEYAPGRFLTKGKTYDWAQLQQMMLEDRAFDGSADDWPNLEEDAYLGPVGQLVRLIEPTVEPDPAWLLTSLLCSLGCIIGRGPTYSQEAIEQRANLFTVLVGKTSSGKGSSWGFVEQILKRIDYDFVVPNGEVQRILTGFASGEVLVKTAQMQTAGGETTVEEDGSVSIAATDGRMFVKEEELAKILKTAQREGSILGPILNDAYDGKPLQYKSMKNGSIVAREAHVSTLAHITPEELLKVLTSTEAANGFGNRFLWVLGIKQRSIPTATDEFADYTEEELSELSESDIALARKYTRALPTYDVDIFEKLIDELKKNIARASGRGRIRIHPTANDLFCKYEAAITHDRPGGLAESMIARARPHFTRLCLVYALLDGSTFIKESHIQAAYAVWRYCRDSVCYIWKSVAQVDAETGTGNPVVDRLTIKLLSAIEKEPGIGRTALKKNCSHSNVKYFEEIIDGLANRGDIIIEAGTHGGHTQTYWATMKVGG